MTNNEHIVLERVENKLDELHNKFGQLARVVEAEAAKCSICRPMVLGKNGEGSVDKRITKLETMNWLRGKVLYLVGGALAGGLMTYLISRLA